MEPQIFLTPILPNNICDESKARKYMNLPPQTECDLIYLSNQCEEHIVWVYNKNNCLKIKPVFAYDYLPEDISSFQLAYLMPQSFFVYRKEIYYIAEEENEKIIGKINTFNTWQEIKILCGIHQIDEDKAYICKAFQFTDNKQNPRKLLGYCWQIIAKNMIYTLPFFASDFHDISLAPNEDMDFEYLTAGKTFFRDNVLWQVYQTPDGQYYANPSPLRLVIK